jgi:aldehyde dehydrogenase (NAD+)
LRFTFSPIIKNRSVTLLHAVSFGGASVNDTIEHLGNPYLPFGGTGSSGIGKYHGKYSFDTFTHYKGMIRKSTLLDFAIRYPPYTKKKLKIMKWFLK